MKKLISLLLAVLMLLAVTAPAMAYAPVTPSATVKHTLSLTNDMPLPYTITYSFALKNEKAIIMNREAYGITNDELAVTGYPTIEPVTYDSTTVFSSNRSYTQELTIDWDADGHPVKFYEPGTYVWKFAKTVNQVSSDEQPSNDRPDCYLYVHVVDDGNNNLNIAAVGIAGDENLSTAKTKGDIEDQYPSTLLNLSVKKMVSGEHGSKSQYFPFTIILTNPAGASVQTYDITGIDATVPATAYHVAQSNPSEIKVNGTESVTVWLKHGQMATINNILYGTAYTITETGNDGYTVTWTDNDTTTPQSGKEVNNKTLTSTNTVIFNNDKQATVPTGIELQTIAPIMGILLAAGMMMILFAGKKKETVR